MQPEERRISGQKDLLRSRWAPPVRLPISKSIRCLAATPIICRSGPASVHFADSQWRTVSWSVIVGSSGERCVSQPNYTLARHDGRQLLHVRGDGLGG